MQRLSINLQANTDDIEDNSYSLKSHNIGQIEARTDNSTYNKLAVKWLNEALCFVSISVVAYSFVLRNRQLLVAAKRLEKSPFGTISPNDRSAAPTVGKSSLLAQDVFPTVAFDALRSGVKNFFRNDDKAERSVGRDCLEPQKKKYETEKLIKK